MIVSETVKMRPYFGTAHLLLQAGIEPCGQSLSVRVRTAVLSFRPDAGRDGPAKDKRYEQIGR